MTENKSLVLEYMEKIATGDVDGALALVDDACIFQAPDGSVMNKTGLRAMFAGLAAILVEPLEQRIVGTTCEGSRVAVEATARTRLGNGRFYANRYHFLFEVADNLIVRSNEYCDTRAADVFSAPAASAEVP